MRIKTLNNGDAHDTNNSTLLLSRRRRIKRSKANLKSKISICKESTKKNKVVFSKKSTMKSKISTNTSRKLSTVKSSTKVKSSAKKYFKNQVKRKKRPIGSEKVEKTERSPPANYTRVIKNNWICRKLFRLWEPNGKIIFYEKCSSLLSSFNDLEPSKNSLERMNLMKCIEEAVYELILAGLKKQLNRAQVTLSLKMLIKFSPSNFSSIITDVLSSFDSYTLVKYSEESKLREAYLLLLKDLNFFLYFPFQEKFDADTIDQTGIMSDAKPFHQRLIRFKTKKYYKQRKFNLFREEPEGYGKLIAELSKPLNKSSPDFMLNIICSIIGTCYLDPNRVIDIVLEAFECQPNCEFFISLIHLLKPSKITLGEIFAIKLSNIESSPSLFTLIANLLQNNIIKLDDVYPLLKPDNETIVKDWDRQLKNAVTYAKQAMKVRLDGKEVNTGEEEEASQASDLIMQTTENQKMLLCKALIDIGAWDIAKIILYRHPKFSFSSTALIAKSLATFATYLIHPIYKQVVSTSKVLKGSSSPYQSFNNKLGEKQANNFEEMNKAVEVLLFLGPYIHTDPVLMFKLIRILNDFFSKSRAQDNLYYLFIDIIDDCLLPGLSFLDSNSSMARDMWTILERFSYPVRYRLYGSWKSEDRTRCHPALINRRVDMVKQIKQLMRRLSKENVKLMGRQLGKLAHPMPGLVFDYILSQIQLFDNLTVPVIDALKYLSPMGYDILGYCLLEALSPADPKKFKKSEELSLMLTADRSRTKHDGSTIAPWIQSLASFAGSICKKYPLELVPLLQYVANQLKAKESLDLLLLKEIVQKMTGIEASEDITCDQLEAMSGGELLMQQAGYFGQLKTAKKAASRLREAASFNDLAISLCILMAQQRNRIIYDESQSELHTKLIGKLYDQCQDTLVQFGSFLAYSSTLDEYAGKIPLLEVLIQQYHVDCDFAFFLWRPIFAHLVSMKYEELRRGTKGHKKLTPTQLHSTYTTASTFVFEPIVEVIREHLPTRTWEDISPQFFVTFWSLTSNDLVVPVESYNKEVSRVQALYNSFHENKELTSSKRRKEMDRCTKLIECLQEEQRKQDEHVKRVMAKLNSEKDTWFAPRTQKSAKNEAVTAFLQLCIFPRCIFTASDALYCAQFVTTVHLLSTPNFSTLICYDRVFCDIIYTVTSCTENEANRYGRFLNSLLTVVMKWHGDKNVFEKECASFPGFVTKFRAANTTVTDSNDHVDYENYRHVCHKWHYKITKCIIVCLESKDFTQIRNSLLVLKRILPSFPKVSNLANAIERWVERVRAEQKDKRHDLFALATSYIGQLKAKIPSLVPEEQFHQKAPEKTGSTKAAESSKPPKSGSDKTEKIKVEKVDKEIKSKEEVVENTSSSQEDVRPPKLPKLEKVEESKGSRTVKIRASEVKGRHSESPSPKHSASSHDTKEKRKRKVGSSSSTSTNHSPISLAQKS